MNTALFSLVVLAFLTLGNGSSAQPSPEKPTAAVPPSQTKLSEGEIYESLDGTSAITLISSDELEFKTDGVNLICRYTKQGDRLRILATIAGTSQAIYFRTTEKGLEGNQNLVLYHPQGLKQARDLAAAAKRRTEFVAQFEQACVQANHGALRTLLESGADPNVRFKGGLTPLLTVIRGDSFKGFLGSQKGGAAGRAESVFLLLEKGADPNLAAGLQDTGSVMPPIYDAFGTDFDDRATADETNLKLAEVLLERGVNLDMAFRTTQINGRLDPGMLEYVIRKRLDASSETPLKRKVVGLLMNNSRLKSVLAAFETATNNPAALTSASNAKELFEQIVAGWNNSDKFKLHLVEFEHPADEVFQKIVALLGAFYPSQHLHLKKGQGIISTEFRDYKRTAYAQITRIRYAVMVEPIDANKSRVSTKIFEYLLLGGNRLSPITTKNEKTMHVQEFFQALEQRLANR